MGKQYRDNFTIVLERVMQFLFWIGIGYMTLKFGLPLLGDALAGIYQSLKVYMEAAPTTEQAGLGLLFW